MTALWKDLTIDTLLTVGLHLALLLALILAVSLLRRRLPDPGRLALALGALAIVMLAVFVSPAELLAPGIKLHWNWDGKILSLLAVLGLIAVLPGLSFRAAGFTWAQNGGALAAVACAGLACLLMWGVHYTLGGWATTWPPAETLAFQGLMPGLHEEPLYRGLALLLIDRLWGDDDVARFELWGARLGWGAILGSLYFGIGHGMGIVHGRFGVDWSAVAVTGLVGFALAWMRERTGSLALPVVAHNLVNLGNRLFG